MSTPPPPSGSGDSDRGLGGLFRNGDFRRLWLTGGAVGSMRWLEVLAVSVYVFEVTGSALTVALLMMARMAPMLLGAAIGALAERFNRKLILLIGLAVMTLTAFGLGLLTAFGAVALWQLAVGAFLNGLFFASEYPVRRTMLAESAGPARAGRALTLEAATGSATRMIGPIVGGLLVETIGLHGAFFLAAAFYGLGFVLVSGARYSRPAGALGAGLLTSIAEGLRYARGDRRIVSALAVTVIINLFGFPFAAMVPVIGKDVLGLSPLPVGFLASAEGLGSFAGALLLTLSARAPYYARIYLAGSAVFVAAVVAFSLSRQFGLSLALLVVAGFGAAGFGAMQGILVFSAAPPAIRSRVMGVLSMSIGASPLGLLHVGLLASWLGAPAALAIIGLEGLIAILIAAILWPELYRRHRPDG